MHWNKELDFGRDQLGYYYARPLVKGIIKLAPMSVRLWRAWT